MSGGLPTAIANKVVDHVNGKTTYSAPTGPLMARLMTANGSASAAGTEVTGGSYAAQSVTWTAAASGSASNSGVVSFTGMPSCTVVGVELWDQSGTPVRQWWGPLAANKVMNVGDTFQFDIGSLAVSVV